MQNQDLPKAAPSTSPAVLAPTNLQSQLHKMQTSLASHVDKVRTLEGVIAEHDTITREVGLLKWFVGKMTSNDSRNHEEDFFGVGDGNARSIGTIVPHE